MYSLHVCKLSDLFKLKIEDFMKLEGFQRLSAENIYTEIQQARVVPDWQILASLNIAGIGPNIAKGILSSVSLLELRNLSVEQLSELNQIGPERANALFHELQIQSESLNELLSCVSLVESKSQKQEHLLPTICFTGKMPEKRSYYENLARERGYHPVDTVTSSLSLLVAMSI